MSAGSDGDEGTGRTRWGKRKGRDSATRIAAAIRQVRREGQKAAFVHAVTEAALAGLAVNLFVGTLGPVVDRDVRLAVVAVTTVVAFVLGVRLRTRRPVVERFERANPAVDEALRTARDVRVRDERGPMARALYDDVLARLRDTSSAKLVDSRRLAVVLVLLLVLSLVTAQVTIEGLDIDDFDVDARFGGGGGDGGRGGPTSEGGDGGETLRDGSLVLGEPEDVEAGSEELPVSVDVGGGADGVEERVYNTGGFAGDTAVESQRAGFAPDEVLEDAELIREYNLRIREEEA
ncbi:hypothetical protein SAMN04487948_12342 [Halogranum amylolyticum]|uniref:Uncharacterized protein n=1 Tax=Halogranum amylolyticum TaxID=660520 RepID=A0A1H8W533_9EURY|nr:hypothetical protein [Halogranum amylolyticum]SEP22710.1 hypothetical protein SAMN04487948_12342 [Halogranum amylolyticum]